ncbi:UNKNOWN [Stylonychia lemnae]|uniref:Uncharacterized protein n=1 Tax=Stylonychia lemnae TaxID=5949 RepID=A0A078AY87_STYLE|nr:UNKNOWN [Stylonychia lemnae]|eukprot:CDW87096.1 UNKNOWN [Stylonychia lemnae]
MQINSFKLKALEYLKNTAIQVAQNDLEQGVFIELLTEIDNQVVSQIVKGQIRMNDETKLDKEKIQQLKEQVKIIQAYSTTDLKEKQQEGLEQVKNLRIQREKRIRKLEDIRVKEIESMKKMKEENEAVEQQNKEVKLQLKMKAIIEKQKERQLRELQRQKFRMESKSKSPLQKTPEDTYLYKKIENRYRNTLILSQQQQYDKILEDRRKMIRDVSLSIKDLKKHNDEYVKRLHDASEKKKQQRLEQEESLDMKGIKNSLSESRSATNQLYKTKFHDQLLEEQLRFKQEQEKLVKRRQDVLNQRIIYDKMVKEIYKPKVSQDLSLEIVRNKQRYCRGRLNITEIKMEQNESPKPYKNYLRELKDIRRSKESRKSISNEDKSPNHYSKDNFDLQTPLKNKRVDSSILNTPMKTQQKSLHLRRNLNIVGQSSRVQEDGNLNKSIDYLSHLRREREAKESERTMTANTSNNFAFESDRKFQKIKTALVKSIKNRDTFNDVLSRMQLFEEQVKRKEKLISVQKNQRGDTYLNDDESVNMMYLQAIDAKLAILENI